MEKTAATKIVDAAYALDTAFGELDTAVSALPENERAAFRRALGDLVGRVYGSFIRPIVRQYPELDRDKS